LRKDPTTNNDKRFLHDLIAAVEAINALVDGDVGNWPLHLDVTESLIHRVAAESACVSLFVY
jgi:hypothetical protein